MDFDVKKEARKQYLKYFRIWFIVVGVLLAICIMAVVVDYIESKSQRINTSAPAERVYDYAEVLTDEEEQKLRDYIALMEPKIKAHIVLVTINEDVESKGNWETVMMNRADDFYDENNYGYDKARGNGVLLLDNWYDGQAGSWLSTCGNVYERFGEYEVNRVLDAVYYSIDDGAYTAYTKYIDAVWDYMQEEEVTGFPLLFVMVLPTIVALIYALINLHQKKAKNTTVATTYVAGGNPVFKVRRDDFIRKNVVTRRIETSSSSSGSRSGGGGGGRGGSHRSSSGTSHGGGGRRR